MLKLNFPPFVPIIHAFFLERCCVSGLEPGCKNPGGEQVGTASALGCCPRAPTRAPLEGRKEGSAASSSRPQLLRLPHSRSHRETDPKISITWSSEEVKHHIFASQLTCAQKQIRTQADPLTTCFASTLTQTLSMALSILECLGSDFMLAANAKCSSAFFHSSLLAYMKAMLYNT